MEFLKYIFAADAHRSEILPQCVDWLWRRC